MNLVKFFTFSYKPCDILVAVLLLIKWFVIKIEIRFCATLSSAKGGYKAAATVVK